MSCGIYKVGDLINHSQYNIQKYRHLQNFKMNENNKRMSASEIRRKTNKPIMEKKRRERINSCLDELKTMVLRAINEESRPSKLEKADILEMTVRYLRSIQPLLQSERARDFGANKPVDTIGNHQTTRNRQVVRNNRLLNKQSRNSPYPIQTQSITTIRNARAQNLHQTLPENKVLDNSMLSSDFTFLQTQSFTNSTMQRLQTTFYNTSLPTTGYTTPPVSPPTTNQFHKCPFPVSPISSVGSECCKSPEYSTSDSSDTSASFKIADSWSEYAESARNYSKDNCSKGNNIWRPWGMMAM